MIFFCFYFQWEPKQSRMLLLTLTDGHSEIKAMEYQPIRSLHSHLPSGTKVREKNTSRLLCVLREV